MRTLNGSCCLFRRTAAAWSVSALIVCLLPGFAAAEDWSTTEKRAAWVIEQFRGADMGGAKFGAAAALARLKLDPDDAEAISRIANYYDNVPAGRNGEQFSYSAVAWALGKYWDKFSESQRDHLKAKLMGFDDLTKHGTENHALMKNVGGYLFAQYWPDESGWLRGTQTSAQLKETTGKNLLAVMRSLYDKAYEENLSTTYAAVHLYPFYALYDCATDPEMKSAANAALHFHVTNLAANHFEGLVIPPYNRENAQQINTYAPGSPYVPTLQWIYWLYWSPAQNRVPVGEDFVRIGENRYVVYAALSEWVPPAAIDSLALGQTTPYELTASAPSFGHNSARSGSPGYWGTGNPGECVRYVYRDKLYAMGSGFFQYYPDEFYTDYNAFGIMFKSADPYNYVECFHPYWRSDDYSWTKGLNSPFTEMAQYQGTAIALFNIPTVDPWAGRGRSDWLPYRDGHYQNLIQEALVRYPKSIDEKTEMEGWIFLREGEVYIAICPLKAYTIDTGDPRAGQFDVIRSAFGQTGYVFDIATAQEFPSFGVFQAAVTRHPPVVDWNRLSVSYTNCRNDTVKAVWRQPDYAASPRVLVRPDLTINGAAVPIDMTYPVLNSPSVKLIDRVLQLQTPAGRLAVDWRGNAPLFTSHLP